MKAIINGKTIAESDDTVYIEGNHYFPPSSVDKSTFTDSDLTTDCFWKGTAHYYNVDGQANLAWYYPDPKEGSVEKVGSEYKDFIAFYPQVTVSD